MNRESFLFKMGVLKNHPDLEKINKEIWENQEQKLWEENNAATLKDKYLTSAFYASSFPPFDVACGRQAVYNLMNIPTPAPMSAFLRGIVEAGKSIEELFVDRWVKAGITIPGTSVKNDNGFYDQVKMVDEETWLSGKMDSVLDLRPQIDCVTPVDLKSKTTVRVQEMIAGERSYDPKHYLQIQAYIYLCRLFHKEFGWDKLGLMPANCGYIFYVSREDPTITKEFFIEANEEIIEHGVKTLKEWKENFLEGNIPERPKSWRWMLDPCRFCEFKKFTCKPDDKEGITSMEESNGIKFAKTLNVNYDLDEVKEKVTKRWN